MALRHWVVLLLLAAIWGSSFILMKKGLESFTPLQVASFRMLFAALILLPWGWSKIRDLQKKALTYCFLVGLIGNGIPALLFTTAQMHINSSLAGMLNATTPVFTLIVAALFFHTPVNIYQKTGVVTGLAGAFVLLWDPAIYNKLPVDSAYGLLVLLATFCYAISVNIIRNKLYAISSLAISQAALSFMALPSLVYLIFSLDGDHLLSYPALKSLGYLSLLGFVGTGMALVLFNRLIKETSAIFASNVTYLIPVTAIMWGIIDGETIEGRHLAGMLIIFLGVYFSGISGKTKH
ncbi:MAG: permease [Vicingaceae bacterium]|nr:MAG: permease [Vicingaceae bacterium]